jgi:hypothetical protein
MRASNGFDRMSTPEELHQVLAVLGEFAPGAWTVSGEDQLDARAPTLWTDTAVEDSASEESLAEFFMIRPELKN